MEKAQLTAQDKKLLIGLALFVIIVGIGYWGIRPQFKAIMELKSQIQDEEDEKSLNEMKVNNQIMAVAANEEYKATLEEEGANYYDMVSASDIDLEFTTLALSYDLNATSLEISLENTPTDLTAYQYSDLYLYGNTESEEYAESVEDTLSAEEETDSKEESTEIEEVVYAKDVYAAAVTMKVAGEREDLQDFLEELNNYDKKILVDSYEWSEAIVFENSDDLVTASSGYVELTVNFRLFRYGYGDGQVEVTTTEE